MNCSNEITESVEEKVIGLYSAESGLRADNVLGGEIS